MNLVPSKGTDSFNPAEGFLLASGLIVPLFVVVDLCKCSILLGGEVVLMDFTRR